MGSLIRIAFGLVLALCAAQASAQNYPSGPVKLIVPVPAGGVTDMMARVLGQRLQEMWGQIGRCREPARRQLRRRRAGGRAVARRRPDAAGRARFDLHRQSRAVLAS